MQHTESGRLSRVDLPSQIDRSDVLLVGIREAGTEVHPIAVDEELIGVGGRNERSRPLQGSRWRRHDGPDVGHDIGLLGGRLRLEPFGGPVLQAQGGHEAAARRRSAPVAGVVLYFDRPRVGRIGRQRRSPVGDEGLAGRCNLATVPDQRGVERIGPMDGDAVAQLTGTAGGRPEDPGKAAGVGINAHGVCRPVHREILRHQARRRGRCSGHTLWGEPPTQCSNPGSTPATATAADVRTPVSQEGTAVEWVHPISRTSCVLRSLYRTVPDVDTVMPVGSPMRVSIQRVPLPRPVELETGSAPASV